MPTYKIYRNNKLWHKCEEWGEAHAQSLEAFRGLEEGGTSFTSINDIPMWDMTPKSQFMTEYDAHRKERKQCRIEFAPLVIEITHEGYKLIIKCTAISYSDLSTIAEVKVIDALPEGFVKAEFEGMQWCVDKLNGRISTWDKKYVINEG